MLGGREQHTVCPWRRVLSPLLCSHDLPLSPSGGLIFYPAEISSFLNCFRSILSQSLLNKSGWRKVCSPNSSAFILREGWACLGWRDATNAEEEKCILCFSWDSERTESLSWVPAKTLQQMAAESALSHTHQSTWGRHVSKLLSPTRLNDQII